MSFKNNHSGFTIIELVVSASIIAIISTLVIANFRGANQRSSLENEAERLSSVIRQAQINALVGMTVDGVRPIGGFGVHLIACATDCHYSLFADTSGDYLYNTSEEIQNLGMLDDNVYIKTLPNSPLDIDFTPPKGVAYINGADTTDEVRVTLGFANTDYEKTLVINRLTGQINTE
jgi:prepilin-type N-terminal cleavage/methylation domain-containing protein